MLSGEAGAATRFLQSKIHGEIKVNWSRIDIEDQQGVDVKLLLRKFLHREGLTGYRVLSESGPVRIVPDDKPSPEERPENSMIRRISLPAPIDGEASTDGRCITKPYF